jgi:ubiquinone/menaquinone biosynthesis C-methylase UbiE
LKRSASDWRRSPNTFQALWISAFSTLDAGLAVFTAPLSRRFTATVIGLTCPEKMLAVAPHTLDDSGAVLVRGAADARFRIGTFVVVFVSMVLHNICCSPGAIDEVRWVIEPGGKLLIPTASLETMDSYLWASFFP